MSGRGLVTAGSVNQRIVIQYYDAAFLTDFGWHSQLESGKWSVHSDEYEFADHFPERPGLPVSPCDIADIAGLPGSPLFSFEVYKKRCGFHIVVVHWVPVITALVFAVLPWIRWHFRLRTMLIATTLVAVVLGLIVYAVR
jgi:hypothetical protein